ncbi:hypothetical protein [Peribacillus frigoritolerans]|uniref:hypothetical protein n=1 Tax=Peribacillus frigoritolerans TaxID=450367 RepID=UPI0039A2E78D
MKLEHDKDLKILFKKIFWEMGHYSRLDVKLGSFGEPEGKIQEGVMELTDADVLGVFLDNDFKLSYSTCECKNGKNISLSKLLFWTKGVMEFLGSDTKGYLVLGQLSIPSHIREMGNRLNITLMDMTNIKGFSILYNTDKLSGNMFDFDAFQYIQSVSDKTLGDLFNYRKYHFWISKHNTNILNIINMLRENRLKLNSDSKEHQILITDLVTLFTISLFDLCSYLVRVNISNPKETVIAYLFDGVYNLKKYNKVVNMMDNILKKSVDNYDEIQHILTVVPDYYNDLLDLVVRIIKRPNESKNILKYFDIILYESVYPKKYLKQNILSYLGEEKFDHVTYKLVTDIVDFIVGTTEIDKKLVPLDV